MSGMMASHCAASLTRGEPEAGAASSYASWTREWSDRDMRELARLYAELGVAWAIDFASESAPEPSGRRMS